MKVIISGKHIELTESIKTYINDKISKIEKYDVPITELDIQISVEKDYQIISVTAYLKGKTIRVDEKDLDLYRAIDNMIDVLNRQVRKYKEKREH